jgi:hypothetical protein
LHRWDSIEMNLKEIEYNSVDLVHMIQDNGQWQARVWVFSLELASLLRCTHTSLLCIQVTVQAY